MNTAIEKPPDPGRTLLDRPQALGVLPTWWFWNQPDNWRLVRWPFAVLVVLLMVILDLLAIGPLAYVLVIVGSLVLGTGLLEGYVRRRALRRRADGNRALGPTPESPTNEGTTGPASAADQIR
jgi:hypothetical protein